jgi:two-component system CheB/CheR fusion protein
VVLREKIGVKTNGEETYIQLRVHKLLEPEAMRGLFLVTFRPAPPPLEKSEEECAEEEIDSEATRRVARLKRELEFTKASHQTTLEELETSNEELKSTNEELQSTNEELQSTNEELETSKEELQSLNEELSTVNNELQLKVEELSRANDDMQNLLNSTDIATIFLDNDLVIQRYTEEATELIKLRPSDIGRPLDELATNLKYKRIATDCRQVLKTLVYRQKEVLTLQGKWYLMRILPYRTSKNVIDGVVLTFVSIDRLKEIEKAGELGRGYFESIVDTLGTPILVLNGELQVVSANRAFYRKFQLGEKQTEGTLIYRLGSGQWDVKKLRKLLEEILPADNAFEDYEVNAEFPNLGRRTFLLNGRRLEQSEEKEEMILLVLEDVTKATE